MGIFSFISDWSKAQTAVTEAQASIEKAEQFAVTADDIPASFWGLQSYDADIAISTRIDKTRALQVPAVNKCVNLISGSAGSLPLSFVAPDNKRISSVFFAQPETDMPRSVSMNNLFTDLFLEGVAWWLITSRDSRGWPKSVKRLDPRTVSVGTDGKVYRTRAGNSGTVQEWLKDADLIRFDSPRGAFLTEASRAIRTLIALETAAQRLSKGLPLIGTIQAKDGVDPIDDEDIAQILRNLQTVKTDGDGDIYVPGGYEYKTFSLTPEQLQMADARQHAVLEIARAAGVDAEELGVSITSRSYFNAQDREMHFLKYVMGPFIRAVEDRLSMPDVTPRGYSARFETEDFLRVDTKTRYEGYDIGLRIGAITHEEMRTAEHKPLTPAPKLIKEIDESVQENTDPTENFSAEDRTEHITFAANAETFAVDKETRTIEGMIVPFGAKPIDGRDVTFNAGDLKWSETSRVKLNLDHDRATSFGVATHLEETDAGIYGKFKIAETDNGDKALALAISGVWDGLSIGAFKAEEGYLLSHVALTPEPAFADARTTSVLASAVDSGTEINAGINKEKEENHMEIETNDSPEVIPAAPVVASVKEPSLYVFDGKRHEHDFSADLFAMNRNSEASQRINEFLAETYAAVDTGDVSATNPTGYRPDLYVDYIEKNAPVYNALRFGSLSDATPFTVPKFNSASGMVADHVEGVEPTEGSFNATSLTVTPSAVSGLMVINREVVDQGGSPQTSALIWKQMNRAYGEALEAKAAALLNGATLAELGTAVAAATTDKHVVHEANLAKAVFIDGASSWDTVLAHRDLYNHLLAVRDGADRPMYPMLAPSNADGTVSARYRSLTVGGFNHVGASSLGATDVNVKSYIGDFEAAPFWASTPQRINLAETVATVSIGLFGYTAGAILDANRLRKITFDLA